MSAPPVILVDGAGLDPDGERTGANGDGPSSDAAGQADQLEVLCGPLLNYGGMSDMQGNSPLWRGSVLVVSRPGATQPELHVHCAGAVGEAPPADPAAANVNGTAPDADDSSAPAASADGHLARTIAGVVLYHDRGKTFWRFDLHLPVQQYEARWLYTVSGVRGAEPANHKVAAAQTFFVPSKQQSMRVMFHSCNGFSVGTDEEAWSGPALWNDVLRLHVARPFHCMLGGGDQIYNDSVRVSGPLKEWTSIGNPRKRRDFPFGHRLRDECDDFYFQNYVRWYSTGAFAEANGQIPQVNIWDDHDIIDGFGSYTDGFMRCPVFRGIGGVAHKYYLLFQHHAPPPLSTFTTDAPQTMDTAGALTTRADEQQERGTYVPTDRPDHPSWIVGRSPGPYINERSLNLYMRLGRRMALMGIDARTERTRHQVNYPDTYERVFARVEAELAASPEVKHLVVLLGIPIAYPRLIWLENILKSPIIGPLRFLNKRFGLAGDFFNAFDGQVDLLDDLDDHYTAHQHKKERKELMLRFQRLAAKHDVRVTILGGDVHLGALGRFYSNPRLNLATENDPRYMVNVISSAITNHPPPSAVANMLARRNKIHHLDEATDETLLDLFDKGPGGVAKAGPYNRCTMPSRNYATLTEAGSFGADTHAANGQALSSGDANGRHPEESHPGEACTGKDGHTPLNRGEHGAGTAHMAASGTEASNIYGPNGLEISLRVEIQQSDKEGHTEGYGLCIPPLEKKKTFTMGAGS